MAVPITDTNHLKSIPSNVANQVKQMKRIAGHVKSIEIQRMQDYLKAHFHYWDILCQNVEKMVISIRNRVQVHQDTGFVMTKMGIKLSPVKHLLAKN